MNRDIKCKHLLVFCFATLLSTNGIAQTHQFSKLVVSPNGHFLMTNEGKPFFWLGDTGWLLFSKLNRTEAETVAYGAKEYWFDAINDPGALQKIWLKRLMLSKPYFDRVPDEGLIADQGKRYEYIAATRGKDYVFFYDYTGRVFEVIMGKIEGTKVKAAWYNPTNGNKINIGLFDNKGLKSFDPPGEEKEGNDWVLILESQLDR